LAANRDFAPSRSEAYDEILDRLKAELDRLIESRAVITV
jgi:hypothetical protein